MNESEKSAKTLNHGLHQLTQIDKKKKYYLYFKKRATGIHHSFTPTDPNFLK